MAEPPWWPALLTAGCRCVLAAVFLMAALTKVTDLPGFTARVVRDSGLPYHPARVVAAFLPWLELTCGFCLLLNVARREAALIVTVLLLLFIGHALARPAGSDCGCFLFPAAVELPHGHWWLLARDLLLLVCGVRVAWR